MGRSSKANGRAPAPSRSRVRARWHPSGPAGRCRPPADLARDAERDSRRGPLHVLGMSAIPGSALPVAAHPLTFDIRLEVPQAPRPATTTRPSPAGRPHTRSLSPSCPVSLPHALQSRRSHTLSSRLSACAAAALLSSRLPACAAAAVHPRSLASFVVSSPSTRRGRVALHTRFSTFRAC
jgi:hypothetical protein